MQEIKKFDASGLQIQVPCMPESGPRLPDWKDQEPDMRFWDKDSPCKQAETNMFSSLLTNAYNQAGVDCWWYVVDWSNENERVFGEDNDRWILRKFKFRGYVEELPPDERQFNVFGIEGLDRFHMFITKVHYTDASKFDENGSLAYPEYLPKLGDVIMMTSNNFFYDVVSVTDRPVMVNERAITWDITLRPIQIQHYSFVPSMSADPLAIRMTETDPLSQNELIDNIKDKVLYNPTDGKNDPFALF